MKASVPRSAPPRGDSLLYLRDVDAAVANEAKSIASARGWTLAQLLAQLLELRRGVLTIAAEYPNVIGAPAKDLLERLELEPRSL
jgi:hypothetical protein